MDECDEGDAYSCFSVSYQFRNNLNDLTMAKECDTKTCKAAKRGSYGVPLEFRYLRPQLIDDSCFSAGMAVGGTLLSTEEVQAEQKRRDAVGNLIPANDAPLKREMIQEALDVKLLQSQGLRPSQTVLKDCANNNGCAALEGLVRSRWRLEKVTGCKLVESGLAQCQFRIKGYVEPTINAPGSLRDNILQGSTASAEFDSEGLFRFSNGRWRVVGGFLPEE